MENEIFLEIKTHAGYFVSNLGRIRKGASKIMATPIHTSGYRMCLLTKDGKRRGYSVHRLVVEAFIGSLEGKEVNHKNFDKTDNRVENLEIVSRLENMRHYHSDERAKVTYKKISIAKTKLPEERAPRKKTSTGRPHGGRREGAGSRPKNAQDGARVKTSFTVTEANLAWLKRQGESRSDVINSLIQKERSNENQD